MKGTLVRYTVRPDRVEENARLIEGVFEELKATALEGVRYIALRLDDGSFVHFAINETAEDRNPITQLAAFRTFQGGIEERCVEPPRAVLAQIVGRYRVMDGG